MKNFIISIIFSCFLSNVNGQLSYTYSCANPSITIGSPNFNQYLDGSSAFIYPFYKDTGTNYYISNNYVDYEAFGEFYFVLYRENNYWKISIKTTTSGETTVIHRFKTVATSNDIDPPCNALWEVLNEVPSGQTCTILFAGSTCILPSSSSSQIMPNVFILPRLTPSEIAAISNPTWGMIAYDVSTNQIKMYDGTGWVVISVTTSGATSQRPLNPPVGAIYYNTTTGKFEGFNGSGWVDLN